MRIVTRPDFDGIVCAVLLRCAESIEKPIYWIEPSQLQSGQADILEGDILANLPYSHKCSMWFDHHVSNKPDIDFQGAFDIAPSAAGVIYKYYREKGMLDNCFDELIHHTDIIDAAQLDFDQVQYPEKYPYILLSMTIKNHGSGDEAYWNLLVDLLQTQKIETILKNNEVSKRCDEVIRENNEWDQHLKEHTRVSHKVSITDFRSLENVPGGNRFLTYSIFPDTIASVKIRHDSSRENVQISIGKSIFTPGLKVNIGQLLADYGGGGHAGAGGCTLKADHADQAITEILDILFKNKTNQNDQI